MMNERMREIWDKSTPAAKERAEFVRVQNLMDTLDNAIFVFGSNESGIHGTGAAKAAVEQYGAVMGVGFGPRWSSFAIPTKDWDIETLPIETVCHYIEAFLRYAESRKDRQFVVTRIGCGLAGFTDWDIAPLFIGHGENVHLPYGWDEIIAKI